jgi:hypothetical protein
VQREFAAHIEAGEQMKSWAERAKELHDAGQFEQARKALAKAEQWRKRMLEIERRYVR